MTDSYQQTGGAGTTQQALLFQGSQLGTNTWIHLKTIPTPFFFHFLWAKNMHYYKIKI